MGSARFTVPGALPILVNFATTFPRSESVSVYRRLE